MSGTVPDTGYLEYDSAYMYMYQ